MRARTTSALLTAVPGGCGDDDARSDLGRRRRGEPTPGEPHDIVIYDYSSDIDGEDVSWREGQGGPTFIYRHVLRLSPRGE